MNILVTGAAGFIGSHVCEHFVSMGHSVIGLDNFDPFYPRMLKEQNIASLKENSKFSFFEADIRDMAALRSVFLEAVPDAVIHLAAKAGVRPSIEAAADYYSVNVNGTLNILDAMKSAGIKKLVFASSSSVYGNNKKVPFSECDPVDNPISPYASTKKSAELLCHVYSHLYGFDITCLRFFTVFGPRQRPDLAIYKFTSLIDKGKPIPFYGDGSTARDYTFIDDIVQGVSAAFNLGKGFQIYNLGESRLTDLKTLVELIESAVGRKAILNKLPKQAGDVDITFADISKAKSELGYAPVYDMKEGISRFVEWYLLNKRILESEV